MRSLFSGDKSMVNWRENVGFLYGVIVLISAIITFFSFYDQRDIALPSVMTVLVVLIEAVIGYFLFGSARAAAMWEELEKQDDNAVKNK